MTPLALTHDEADNGDEYLLVSEAAKIPRVDKATLYRRIAADPTFPALKMGGVVRIPKARFLKWLRQHEQGRATRRPA